MKNLFVFYGIFMLFGQVWAQPGYIGKKTPISIETHIFPNFLQVLNQEDNLSLNLRLGASVERVLSRRFSLGISSNLYQTRLIYEKDSIRSKARIRGATFGLDAWFYSFSRRGNIAPLGPYQKISIFYTPYEITDVDRRFNPNGDPYLGNFHDLGIAITIGTQRIYKNSITYNWGIQLGWLMNALRRETVVEQIYLKDISTTRLRGFWGFSINGGIGFLIF